MSSLCVPHVVVMMPLVQISAFADIDVTLTSPYRIATGNCISIRSTRTATVTLRCFA